MTKAVKFQALNTFKPYAVFYRTGGQIENFILLMVGGHLLLTMTGLMVVPKDSMNLQKSTLMDISLTNPLKDTLPLQRSIVT